MLNAIAHGEMKEWELFFSADENVNDYSSSGWQLDITYPVLCCAQPIYIKDFFCLTYHIIRAQ